MLTRVDDDISVKFLRWILPEEGFYIAAIKTKGMEDRWRHKFASTPEELWTILEDLDRNDYPAYHACASFKEAINRKQRNALGAKAFWLDLDVDPEDKNKFKTQDEAIEALKRFCTTLELPDPIIVSSGYGLHVYWPLQQMLDPETWEHYATGLKSLCHQHELRAGPERTADIASVLRTPGTHNRKHGTVRDVKILFDSLDIELYEIDRFKIFADHATGGQQQQKGSSELFKLLGEMPDYLIARKRPPGFVKRFELDEDDFPPSSGELIAEQCAQVRALRDNKGNLSEPLWYAALGVLAFCEDGERRAHEWSSGDQRYTEQVTQERLERARQFGPTTCAKFHGLNPTVCRRCPHWAAKNFASPITLGEQHAPPATATAATAPQWHYTKGGALQPKSYPNTVMALSQLGIRFRHDIFHNKKIVEGDAVENFGRELSDAACRALRDLILTRYGIDCGKENVQQAAERACEQNRFDPVLDYLASLQWDGQHRLDRWMVVYLGAEDTPLNRSIGRKMLIAAVRRARLPGCKFDYAVVLEGKQRTGKSSTLRILAGEENFSDQPVLHLETRAQQEAIEGVWICELSELAGLRRAEVEAVKNFLSKTDDKARAAYAHFRTDPPRRCIFVGTTNDAEYLRDATGNSRFWPVRCGTIELEALRRDRDQLWAEAVAMEAKGEPLVIPAELYGAAAEQQDQRLMQDAWDDLLAGVRGAVYNDDGANAEERIASTELLTRHLGLQADKMNDAANKRLGQVARRLGWEGPKNMRFNDTAFVDGKTQQISVVKKGYRRPPPEG